MSNEDGNELFSHWLKSYFQELLINPYPQLRLTISHVETHVVSSNPAAPVSPKIATPSPTYDQTFSGLSPPDHDLVTTLPAPYVPASPRTLPQLVPICSPVPCYSIPPTYRPTPFTHPSTHVSPDILKPRVQWGTSTGMHVPAQKTVISPDILKAPVQCGTSTEIHPRLPKQKALETVCSKCSNIPSQPFSSPNQQQQPSAAITSSFESADQPSISRDPRKRKHLPETLQDRAIKKRGWHLLFDDFPPENIKILSPEKTLNYSLDYALDNFK